MKIKTLIYSFALTSCLCLTAFGQTEFEKLRDSFHSNLLDPRGVFEAKFRSGDLLLTTLITKATDNSLRPGIVFLGNDSTVDDTVIEFAYPFIKAGFVVSFPMLRGRNDSPGNVELCYGEVDDAIAAGKHLAQQPNVDANNVFVVGIWEGAIVGMLSVMQETPFKAGLMVGHLNFKDILRSKKEFEIPFDATNPQELRVRNPVHFPESLQVPIMFLSSFKTRKQEQEMETFVGKAAQVVHAQ